MVHDKHKHGVPKSGFPNNSSGSRLTYTSSQDPAQMYKWCPAMQVANAWSAAATLTVGGVSAVGAKAWLYTGITCGPLKHTKGAGQLNKKLQVLGLVAVSCRFISYPGMLIHSSKVTAKLQLWKLLLKKLCFWNLNIPVSSNHLGSLNNDWWLSPSPACLA